MTRLCESCGLPRAKGCNPLTHLCGKCAVSDTPAIITDCIITKDWGDSGDMIVLADMDKGATTVPIFHYYSDELHFHTWEFIGKTKAQAVRLFHQKDIEYLRS